MFQLAPTVGSDQVAQRLRGRTLGSSTFSFVDASEKMLAGGSFRATTLTDQFGLSDYRNEYGVRATPLLVVEAGEIVGAFTDEGSPTVLAGQTIISLIAGEESDRSSVDREEMESTLDQSRPHEQEDLVVSSDDDESSAKSVTD